MASAVNHAASAAPDAMHATRQGATAPADVPSSTRAQLDALQGHLLHSLDTAADALQSLAQEPVAAEAVASTCRDYLQHIADCQVRRFRASA